MNGAAWANMMNVLWLYTGIAVVELSGDKVNAGKLKIPRGFVDVVAVRPVVIGGDPKPKF